MEISKQIHLSAKFSILKNNLGNNKRNIKIIYSSMQERESLTSNK